MRAPLRYRATTEAAASAYSPCSYAIRIRVAAAPSPVRRHRSAASISGLRTASSELLLRLWRWSCTPQTMLRTVGVLGDAAAFAAALRSVRERYARVAVSEEDVLDIAKYLYSINVLELAAENMGTFSFLAQARELDIHASHSLDFVDNTAAEYSADRGSARVPGMQELVRRRFDALDQLGISSMVERITSTDNEWADALSRGEERMHDVLRMARSLGWVTRRLYPHRAWRDLSELPRLDA